MLCNSVLKQKYSSALIQCCQTSRTRTHAPHNPHSAKFIKLQETITKRRNENHLLREKKLPLNDPHVNCPINCRLSVRVYMNRWQDSVPS